jgi:hypothetical protein
MFETPEKVTELVRPIECTSYKRAGKANLCQRIRSSEMDRLEEMQKNGLVVLKTINFR